MKLISLVLHHTKPYWLPVCKYWVNLFKTIKLVCQNAVGCGMRRLQKLGTVGALWISWFNPKKLRTTTETVHCCCLITRPTPGSTLLAVVLAAIGLVNLGTYVFYGNIMVCICNLIVKNKVQKISARFMVIFEIGIHC